MKIVHLNTTDNEGGAARAAYRLHSELVLRNIDSKMIVQYKKSVDNSVRGPDGIVAKLRSLLREEVDKLPLKRYYNRDSEIFSPAWLPERRATQISRYDPDIVHLHWLGKGFMRPSTIGMLECPVVWTLHDMWPFTGGCHVANSCNKYETECGTCPHLASDKQNDLANSVWTRKETAWKDTDFNLVAPSQWMANCARDSTLFSKESITVIPNGLDVMSFRPRGSTKIRSQLDVDQNTDIICFGTDHHASYKGFDLLVKSLQHVTELDSTEFVSFGPQHESEFPDNIDVTHLGYLENDSLQQLYSDADVVIVPSRVESFGQVASESLASGTPVVAFNSTGLKDVVSHKETGYLAEPYDPKDLADGVKWVLSNEERNNRLSQRARSVATDRFSIETVATKYQRLYEDILETN